MTMTSKKTEDLSGTHLWLVLMKAYHALAGVAVRSIESLELGLSDFGILEILLHKGPLPVNDIGRRIHLTSGAITVAVDRLESGGWVARRPHPTDRRARVVHLTPRGQERAERIFASHKAEMDSVARVLSSDERRTLMGLLKKLGTFADQREETHQMEA
jgi:MarR family 2-MHQ and catechol resistance regulon transcriptional repressor